MAAKSRGDKRSNNALIYGVAALGAVVPLLMVSDAWGLVVRSMWSSPEMMRSALPHLAVVAMVSALSGASLLLAARRQQRRVTSAGALVRARRGTVITETLITIPPFFLLFFGLSQLSINSIAQILANVAAQRAAQSVWVWEPESVTGGRGITGGTVNQRACVGVAGAMAPVAPGEYSSLGVSLPDAMKRQREALVLSQAIGAGAVNSGLSNMLTTLGGAAQTGQTVLSMLNGGDPNSVSRALDESSFPVRSWKKFTAAYAACEVSVAQGNVTANGASAPGYNITMTYYHYQAMPFVGRYFSGWWTQIPFTNREIEYGDKIGEATAVWQKTGRIGHFVKIERVIGWPKQVVIPNNRLPNNNGPGGPGSGGSSSSSGAIRGGVSNSGN